MFHKSLVVEKLKKKHDLFLSRLEELYDDLNNLCYEGKVSFGKNFEQVKRKVAFFKGQLFSHIQFDDEVVFSYLVKHVPRLEGMVSFLKVEHVEVKRELEEFEDVLRRADEEKSNSELITMLRNKGLYFVCLLRSHMQSEYEGIYRVIESELRPKEIEELQNLFPAEE